MTFAERHARSYECW